MSDRQGLRVVGFEPFDTGSHRAIRESITRHSRHRWRWLTRPGRGWKWRIRLSAVEMAEEAVRLGAFDEPPDVIFATSLLDAGDLRASLPRGLRDTPLVVYMHENQAAYPWSDHPKVDAKRDVHFAITNLTSVLAADLALFNSRWNLESFTAGVGRILAKANAVALAGWRERVEARSRVLWPPVEPPPVLHNVGRERGGVVWPHRWEHDKGPQELLEIAERDSERLDLRWTILGCEFPQRPEALEAFRERMASRIDAFGHEPDRLEYWRRLAGCEWVLSTAVHEFFGVAVVEALLAGCLPWLPQRLSYPELLPPEARGLSPQRPPADPEAVRRAIRGRLEPAVAPNAVARLDEALSALRN